MEPRPAQRISGFRMEPNGDLIVLDPTPHFEEFGREFMWKQYRGPSGAGDVVVRYRVVEFRVSADLHREAVLTPVEWMPVS